MHQPIRAVLGIATTALVLIGAPLLLRQQQWPLSGDTTWDYVRLSLFSFTMPPAVGHALVLIVLWALWGLFALLVTADVIALLRGQVPRIALLRLVLTGAVGSSVAVSSPAVAAVSVADASLTEDEQNTDTTDTEATPQVLERTRTLSGFGFDSAQLTPAMVEELTPTVELLQLFGDPSTPIVVTGHSDTIGDPEYNQGLSHHRAEEVAVHLAEHLGDGWTITTTGAGAEQPRNHPELGPAADRRAEISYTLAPQQQTELEPAADNEQAEADHESTADTQQTGLPIGALLAGAAAGSVAGVIAGRLTAPGRRRQHEPLEDAHEPDKPQGEPAPEPSTGIPLAVTRNSDGPLITEDGHVRIADTLTVSAQEGLGFTGQHAVGVCASIIGRALADPDVRVITTQNLLTRAGAPERPQAAGLTQSADTASAITEAELAYITGARPGQPTWTLLMVEASMNARVRDRLVALTRNQASNTLVLALEEENVFPAVICDAFDRVETTGTNGTRSTYQQLRLLHIDQQTFAAHFAPTEETPHPENPTPEPPSVEPTQPPSPEPAQAAEDTNKISVRLFAPQPQITYRGTDIGANMRTSARKVIAYLALHPAGVGTEALTDALFPEVTERQAKQLRNTACSSARSTVRKALDDEAAEIIEVRSGRYQLVAQSVEVDVWRFDAALKNAAAEKAEDESYRLLRSAAAEYRSVLLTEADLPWIEEKRQYYRRRAADCFVSLAKAIEEPAEAIPWLERARESDDVNEAVYQELMKAQAALGRLDAVRRTYKELCENLETMQSKPSKSAIRLLNELACSG